MTVVKINALTCPPEQGPELEKRFGSKLGSMDDVPGFIGFKLLRPTAGEERYFVFTEWQNQNDYDNWVSGRSMEAHSGAGKPVSTQANLLEFEIALESYPKN